MLATKGFWQRRPELVLAAVTVLWGSTFIVTKDAVRSLPPLPYVCLRFGLASIVLVALFPRALRPSPGARRDGVLLGALQGVGLLTQVVGQMYTTASKSAFITALHTVLTPVVGYALYRSRPRIAQAAGLVVGSLGLLLLTWPSEASGVNVGDLLTVVSALVFAVFIVEITRRAPAHDYAVLTAWQTIGALLLYLVLLAVVEAVPGIFPREVRAGLLAPVGGETIWPLPAHVYAQVLYMALACSVVTFLGQTWAMRRMSATHAAVVFTLEPVFATIAAVAVEGAAEWPGLRGSFGAVLIFVGVMIAELLPTGTGGRKTSEPQSTGGKVVAE